MSFGPINSSNPRIPVIPSTRKQCDRCGSNQARFIMTSRNGDGKISCPHCGDYSI